MVRTPVELRERDDLREETVLWTSEQNINAAIIFSCEHLVVRIRMGKGRSETNHDVGCVGEEGPAASMDLFDDEGIRNESRLLFRRGPAIPDVADVGDSDDIHRRCVL